MTDNKSDAKKYRLAQIQKIFDLYTATTGKSPTSPEEIDNWLKSPEGQKALAYDRVQTGKSSRKRHHQH
jgi:hypothetical protein